MAKEEEEQAEGSLLRGAGRVEGRSRGWEPAGAQPSASAPPQPLPQGGKGHPWAPRHPLELRCARPAGQQPPAGSCSSSQQPWREEGEGRTGWAVWEERSSPHQPFPVPELSRQGLAAVPVGSVARGCREPLALAGQQPQSCPLLTGALRGRFPSQLAAPSTAQET